MLVCLFFGSAGNNKQRNQAVNHCMIYHLRPMRQLSTTISKTLGRSSSNTILLVGGASANNNAYTHSGQIWWWTQRRWCARGPTTASYRRGLRSSRGHRLIRPGQQLLQTRAKGEDARGMHTHGSEKGEIGNTIYALATASGRAAIAVVRVSGPACLNVCWMKPPTLYYHSVFVFLLLCLFFAD